MPRGILDTFTNLSANPVLHQPAESGAPAGNLPLGLTQMSASSPPFIVAPPIDQALAQPAVLGALIALVGVVITLVLKDVVMALLLARRKRGEDLADKLKIESLARFDLVRRYSDPLMMAARSLQYRLREITTQQNYRYLLSAAPATNFVTYKRISTIYRLAALLGWVRAFRREQSILDPYDSVDIESITRIEQALADGHHMEQYRLKELVTVWALDVELTDQAASQLSSELDSAAREYLAQVGYISPYNKLTAEQQVELLTACADRIRRCTGIHVNQDRLKDSLRLGVELFSIREAYIYRDWQTAIGDLMLRDTSGLRKFEVMGFGEFEDRYAKCQLSDTDTVDRRYFGRLDTLFADIDFSKPDTFDARLGQLRRLEEGCAKLATELETKRGAMSPHSRRGQDGVKK